MYLAQHVDVESAIARLPVRRARDPPIGQAPGPIVHMRIADHTGKYGYYLCNRLAGTSTASQGYLLLPNAPLLWGAFLPTNILSWADERTPGYSVDLAWVSKPAFADRHLRRAWQRSKREVRTLPSYFGG